MFTMLRKVLIGLGLVVAVLPYLVLPSWIDTILFTLIGLAIVFLTMIFGDDGVCGDRRREEASALLPRRDLPRELPVKRGGIENYLEMYVKKETVIDMEQEKKSSDKEDASEKKATALRKRKQKTRAQSLPGGAS